MPSLHIPSRLSKPTLPAELLPDDHPCNREPCMSPDVGQSHHPDFACRDSLHCGFMSFPSCCFSAPRYAIESSPPALCRSAFDPGPLAERESSAAALTCRPLPSRHFPHLMRCTQSSAAARMNPRIVPPRMSELFAWNISRTICRSMLLRRITQLRDR